MMISTRIIRYNSIGGLEITDSGSPVSSDDYFDLKEAYRLQSARIDELEKLLDECMIECPLCSSEAGSVKHLPPMCKMPSTKGDRA